VVGPDSVSTATYGATTGCGEGFAGTSAAAPYVAGAAALVKQRFPSFGTGGIVAWLEADAEYSAQPPGPLFLAPSANLRPWVASVPDGGPSIVSANADGTFPWRLPIPAGGRPEYSPNGAKLVYSTSLTGTGDIWTATALDGSGQQRLTTDGQWTPDPTWTPDGTNVLNATHLSADWGMWLIKADGSGRTSFLAQFALTEPSYSPDGKLVVASGGDDPWLTDASGKPTYDLTRGGFRSVHGPVFSPDSGYVAFSATTFLGTDEDIWIVNVVPFTHNYTTFDVTPGPASEVDPNWLGDGRFVFSRRPPSGTYDLYVASADGTNVRRLTRSESGLLGFDLAPQAAGSPMSLRSPAIAGEARIGHFVAVTDQGIWRGAAPLTTSFQWKRCDASGANCVPIAGATDSVYRFGAQDVGARLRADVTVSNGLGGATVTTPASGVVLAARPVSVTQPTLTGAGTVGSPITASPGTWSGAVDSLQYLWLRCNDYTGCSTIPGATASVYVAQPADGGQSIRVAAVATSTAAGGALGGGVTIATSRDRAIAPLPPPPVTTTTTRSTTTTPRVAIVFDAAIDAVPYVSANEQYSESIEVGQTLTFNIAVTNAGTQALTGLRFTYTALDQARVDSASVANGGCVLGAVVSCEVGSLSPNNVAAGLLTLHYTGPGEYANTFTIGGIARDDVSGNNQRTILITVVPKKQQQPVTKPKTKPKTKSGVHKTGTARANTLVGTAYADVLRGLGGNDVLKGLGGNDTLEGGSGNDTLTGGAGTDTIRCGPGKDTVIGARGDMVAKDCEKRR
jgi:Ca2+-binding RTX toxin-like protein